MVKRMIEQANVRRSFIRQYSIYPGLSIQIFVYYKVYTYVYKLFGFTDFFETFCAYAVVLRLKN